MKKFLYLILVLTASWLLIGSINFLNKKKDETKDHKALFSNEIRSVFVSYIEYQSLLLGKTENIQKEEINKIINNLDEKSFNMLILQVRPFSDSIYPSNIFPSSKTIVPREGEILAFDYLKYFIDKCHEKEIKVHAWINPYRIRSNKDIESISNKNPAYKWLNTNNVKVIDNGIFYNPASDEVKSLIINGIKEILDNYNVDGICFDDYFYPDKTIDLDNYNDYKKVGGEKSLDDYRFDQVSSLIEEVYNLVNKYDKEFGISPEGNIENNYQKNYADIKKWLSEKGYINYIMPQIYYGFYNQNKPFIKTLKEWNDLVKIDSIKLIPALAFYKSGKIDTYALSGNKEWIENTNIIAKQIIASRSITNYNGFSLFRYDYIFNKSDTKQVMEEKENLFELIINK